MRPNCTRNLALSVNDKNLHGHRHHGGTRRRRIRLFPTLLRVFEGTLQKDAYLTANRAIIPLGAFRDALVHGKGQPKGMLKYFGFLLAHGIQNTV